MGLGKASPLATGRTTKEKWLTLRSSLGDQVEVSPGASVKLAPVLTFPFPCLL